MLDASRSGQVELGERLEVIGHRARLVLDAAARPRPCATGTCGRSRRRPSGTGAARRLSRSTRLSTAPSIVAGTSKPSRSPTTACPVLDRGRSRPRASSARAPRRRTDGRRRGRRRSRPAGRQLAHPEPLARPARRARRELSVREVDHVRGVHRHRRSYSRGASSVGRVVTTTSRLRHRLRDLEQQRPRVRVEPVGVLDDDAAPVPRRWPAAGSRRAAASCSPRARCRPSPAVSSLSGIPTGTMPFSSGRRRRSSGAHGTLDACGPAHQRLGVRIEQLGEHARATRSSSSRSPPGRPPPPGRVTSCARAMRHCLGDEARLAEPGVALDDDRRRSRPR